MPDQNTETELKEFTLADAHKALVMRTYMVTLEKKLLALLASDSDGSNYTAVTVALRTLLAGLEEIEDRQRNLHSLRCPCWEGYECCSGICEVWCS